MPRNLLYWIGWQYLRLVAPGGQSGLEWRGGFVAPPGRILVCFPEDYDSFLRAWRAMQEIGVDRRRMVFVARRPFLQAMGRAGGEKRIVYEPGDINLLGLAKKRLREKVRRAVPAMAVDLHWGGIPLGAHLALRSKAAVRAGLTEAAGGQVYNVIVRPVRPAEYERAVAALFQYLGLASATLAART